MEIVDVRNTTIFLGAVAGIVSLHKCRKVTLVVAARRVQMGFECMGKARYFIHTYMLL